MVQHDALVIEACRELLGFGSIRSVERRKAGWKDTTQLMVHSRRAIELAVIPFFDQFLLSCHKREQFDAWRADFEAYVAAHPSQWGKGPSVCSMPDCERPVRGRGLCRRHYYVATGN